MKILGLQKLTLLDFPGRVAAIVFTGGCSFRCPFCQNSSLVLSPESEPEVSEEEFRRFLRRRQGLLDGICVTGGEPTLHADLPEFLASIKDAGYLVKLDTNGSNPLMLQRLLREGLLDYVAMDVKAGPSNYARVCGLQASPAPAEASIPPHRLCTVQPHGDLNGAGQASPAPAEASVSSRRPCTVPSGRDPGNAGQTPPAPAGGSADSQAGRTAAAFSDVADTLLENVRRSAELLKDCSIDYEFRTTVVKGLHTTQDFDEIASWLSGCSRYYLQSFRDCPEVLLKNHPFSAFSEKEMQGFLSIVQKEIPQAALRGL